MSSLRIKIERERLEKLEAAAKGGPAPRVFMPEQSTTATAREIATARQNAADAAIPTLRGSGSVRSRTDQPAPAPRVDTSQWPYGVDLEAIDRRHAEQAAVARRERAADEAARQAEAQRQRLAKVAQATAARKAGEDFERETARLAIEDATGKLTLAEFDAVERLVQTQYPAGISDPNIWRLAANEYRDNIRVRKLWVFAPYSVINGSSDEQLAVMFETSVETIKNLRAEEL